MLRIGVIIFAVVLHANVAFTQCNTQSFMESCRATSENFTYLKGRSIDLLDREEEEAYYYFFSKGNRYLISTCDASDRNQLIVTILDRKGTVVASNYNPEKEKFYDKVIFQCTSTGKYDLIFEKANKKNDYCGMCVLGFKKGLIKDKAYHQ